MRNLFALMFVLVSMVVSGCFSSHGSPDLVGSAVDNSNPFVGGDAGPTEPDLGPIEPDGGRAEIDFGRAEHDSGPVVMADAGMDAGPVIEPDAGVIYDFDITTDNLRQSTILVAGGDVWQNVAQFRARRDSLRAIHVLMYGDSADVSTVAIAADGYVLGRTTLPAGEDMSAWINLDDVFEIPADGSRIFQIWVKVPPTVPGTVVLGATVGNMRSGDRFRFGVDAARTDTGLTISTEAIMGNEFQVRKSKPTITRQSLSFTTLSNGLSQDFYKFQASADSAGSVSFHAVPFNAVSNGELTLSGFGLRKGSFLMDTADYDIVDEFGNNLEAGSVSFSTGVVHWIIIVFRNDGQTVTGSGNIYTLQATPSGVDAGDSISFRFHHTGNGSTGYLLDDPAHSSLDTSAWGSPETGPVVEAGFIWSDLSELPHSNRTGIAGGSRDWTDGRYIEDLTQTSTLSR